MAKEEKKIEDAPETFSKENLSDAQKAYRETIEQYAKTNPLKFPSKKAELDAKLKRVIGIKKDGGRDVFVFSDK